jgi:hypothetical protein
MHEDFTRKEEVKGSSDRSFGFVMAAFFALVALFLLLHGPLSSIRWWALVVAAAFFALALLQTAPLRPVLFYAAVTPIDVLMRWAGKDPLRLCRNAAVASYWIPREPPGPAPDSMKQQF